MSRNIDAGGDAVNPPNVKITRQDRFDEYRDLLETWTRWWNHAGRYYYHHNVLPPLTKTDAALACQACHNAGMEPGDRCAVCGRMEML